VSRLPVVSDHGPSSKPSLADLTDAALAGDERAWRTLVDTLKGVVWKTLYGFDMSEDDRKDAFASTFFRLYERLGTIREPEKLPGWLATTARNEAHTVIRRKGKLVPVAELPLRGIVGPDHDESMLDDELRQALRSAFASLPAKAQAVLRLVCADPPISYDEISEILDMPRGSIGSLRRRYLELLRKSPELAPFIQGGHS
jgi:RNA polymerase sigma factor (sigma-70 family)